MLLSMCVTLPTQLPRQADLPPPKRRETLLSMNRPALGESPWGVTASEHFKLRHTIRKMCPFSEAKSVNTLTLYSKAALSPNNLLLLKSV